MAEKPSSSGPEKVLRIGECYASIFKNTYDTAEGARRVMRTVSLQRRFKDGDGNWQSSSSYTHSQLNDLVEVGKMAQEHLKQVEGDVTK